MPRIDLHAHCWPQVYADAMPPLPLPSSAPAALVETMDRWEIDAAAISPGPPGPYVVEPRRPERLARLANEGLAELARAHPQRFTAVGIVPLPDVEAALEETRFLFDELEHEGVMLLSNVAGTYLGDPAWDPLLEELDRRGAYVFVHPWMGPYEPPLPHPTWLYEFTFDTTRAIANLIYSGAFERFPAIRWQFAHLGGTAPFLAHRLASLADRQPDDAAAAPAGALAYLRRLWWDTGLSNHLAPLATTLQVTGIEHVVFGTDWPYAVFPASGSDPAPELAGIGIERSTLDFENARVLVPKLAARIK
jgi:6-methylsalicylate decarboxylase